MDRYFTNIYNKIKSEVDSYTSEVKKLKVEQVKEVTEEAVYIIPILKGDSKEIGEIVGNKLKEKFNIK